MDQAQPQQGLPCWRWLFACKSTSSIPFTWVQSVSFQLKVHSVRFRTVVTQCSHVAGSVLPYGLLRLVLQHVYPGKSFVLWAWASRRPQDVQCENMWKRVLCALSSLDFLKTFLTLSTRTPVWSVWTSLFHFLKGATFDLFDAMKLSGSIDLEAVHSAITCRLYQSEISC